MTYLFQCMEIFLAYPCNFLDSLIIGVKIMEWKIRWWGCYKPVLKLWMILLDYIENAGECESVRRVDDDSFPIVLVGLAV